MKIRGFTSRSIFKRCLVAVFEIILKILKTGKEEKDILVDYSS